MAGSLTSSIKYNSLKDGNVVSINIRAGGIVHIDSINVKTHIVSYMVGSPLKELENMNDLQQNTHLERGRR